MPLERVQFLTLTRAHSSLLTSPRLPILNAELPLNDGESGAGDDGVRQDDGRERSHTTA